MAGQWILVIIGVLAVEHGIKEFQWISTASNNADMFTKKLAGPEHKKHMMMY